ncbi:MAG TPA: hypothetical protein VFJ69_07730 [Actinomycetota bacterium]|nr:hypothetical protein [Actinomycetota bacterium]
MLEERLERAVGALERSVTEVDAAERFQALGRRRRRQRTVTAALAWVVVAAVLAGAVLAVGIARRSDPRPRPVVGPDPTARPGWRRPSGCSATRWPWRSES